MARQGAQVLSQASLPSMFTLPRQCRLHWLGHVHCIQDGHIPKDLLYGELASGRRPARQPQLHYRNVVRCDVKSVDINTESWESLAAIRSKWRGTLTKHLKSREEKLKQVTMERQLQQTKDRTHMQPLQQRLSLPYQTLQSQTSML